MRIFRTILAVATLSLAVSAVPAQDSEEQPTETPPPAQEPDERRAPAPADDVFIPTEELPVTEEVTFPVDI